jgi:predicted lipoprotein with Yx(FWY)xxD motif
VPGRGVAWCQAWGHGPAGQADPATGDVTKGDYPRLRSMKKTLLALAVGAVGAVATLALATAAMPRESAGPTLTVKSSAYGRVLFDGRGYVLYAFTRDVRGRSACYGACAKAWPVYFAKGGLTVGPGVKRSLLGTTKRRDGRRQVTYAGRPLYHYVGDRRPGQILCQNVVEFGGTWLVVRPSGRLVR